MPFAPVIVAVALLVLIGVAMDANFYPLVIVAQDALPDRVGLASGVVIGVSVGLGAGCTAFLGALVDAHGLQSALWGCVGLAMLALACAAAGRVMRDQRSGRIVNITSPAYRMALPNYTAYAASKAGVDAVTRSAAAALAPYGVLVNSVAPGMMDTEMQRTTEADLARLEGRADLDRFLAERTARVKEWNKPVWWPVALAVLAAVAVLWLALRSFRQRERTNALGEQVAA